MKPRVYFLIISACCAILAACCPKQDNKTNAAQIPQREIILQKALPLVYALQTAAPDAIVKDEVLASIGKEKFDAQLQEEENSLSPTLAKLSDEEIAAVAARLKEIAPQAETFIKSLRAEGKYRIAADAPDSTAIRIAWETDAAAMNLIINTYALGIKPHYAKIDSTRFDPKGNEIKYVRDHVRTNVLKAAKDGPFYAVTLETAMDWLDANGRNEPADFEPMADGINKAAYDAIKNTDWSKYPYTLILVLGAGPERPGEPISAQSRLRAQYAAMLYKEGKAPFIVLSGGRVHPYLTPYSEAFEMKKYLMETWGLPESALIAEPHARHTTTNIRNTVRIMLEQGIPTDKPGIITSGTSHIDYACGDWFRGVCTREMGLIPCTYGERLSPREVEFIPNPDCTQVAAWFDPLDP